jgi:hypothetical protein
VSGGELDSTLDVDIPAQDPLFPALPPLGQEGWVLDAQCQLSSIELMLLACARGEGCMTGLVTQPSNQESASDKMLKPQFLCLKHAKFCAGMLESHANWLWEGSGQQL